MVVIRLNRGGSKKRPKYRITVADSRRWLGGKFLEVIGHYNPAPRGAEQKVVLDVEKAEAWIAKGAQATPRVMSLIRMAKGQAKDANFDPKKVPKKKPAPKAAAPAPASEG